MNDSALVAKLVALASTDEGLQEAQRVAARKLLAMDGEHYPADGCAITQSALAQAAGLDVPDTYLAIEYGRMLQKRGWQLVPLGAQRAGDVGSTCKDAPDHGSDHVYLVLRAVNDDEMIVADNQARVPHMRYASGKGGKTATTHFLRATGAAASVQAVSALAGKPIAPSASERALRRILDVLQELVADVQKGAEKI